VIPRSSLSYVIARLRLPTHLLQCPHWASHQAPEVHPVTGHPEAGLAPVSCVFPAGAYFAPAGDWGSGNSALAISRGSRSTPPLRMGTAAAFLACYCPLHLSDPGKPSDPGITSEFLPAKPGIQQGASRRSQGVGLAVRPRMPARYLVRANRSGSVKTGWIVASAADAAQRSSGNLPARGSDPGGWAACESQQLSGTSP
jgi:hypothetical protein